MRSGMLRREEVDLKELLDQEVRLNSWLPLAELY